MQGLPHAPCRLQLVSRLLPSVLPSLPPHAPCRLQLTMGMDTQDNRLLCLHTLRADCNFTTAELIDEVLLCLHTPRADCNKMFSCAVVFVDLCLHTPRADCNSPALLCWMTCRRFASTRPVQIATKLLCRPACDIGPLPPHAPCRLQRLLPTACPLTGALPPHAPCRLQHSA